MERHWGLPALLLALVDLEEALEAIGNETDL